MSILDKFFAAVTPPESESARREARERALRAAKPGDWLSLALEQHERIEVAFSAVKAAATTAEQVARQKELAALLTGHAVAEEAVLYPAPSAANEEPHATKAYAEQSAAKLQMGLLERLQPLSPDYLDKLEHPRGAVARHMFEEEGNWFLDIRTKLPLAEQKRLTGRFNEEFARYMGERGDEAHAL